MKTQADCYRTLLHEETLLHRTGDKVKLIDGMAISNSRAVYTFNYPNDWEIYKEPKKPKLINVLAYVDSGGEVRSFTENSNYPDGWIKEGHWKRLPSLDQKDVEVEE